MEGRSTKFCYGEGPGTVKVLKTTSEGSKGITHYLGDKNRFDVSSEGPSSDFVTLIPDEGPSLETSNLFLSPR